MEGDESASKKSPVTKQVQVLPTRAARERTQSTETPPERRDHTRNSQNEERSAGIQASKEFRAAAKQKSIGQAALS